MNFRLAALIAVISAVIAIPLFILLVVIPTGPTL